MNTAQDNVYFYSQHKPGLQSGHYQVSLKQTVETNGSQQALYDTEKDFFVGGERFNLRPEQIGSAFPPSLNEGEHSNVFPHLTLTRDTLPWERNACNEDDQTSPWLALLLIDESEKTKVEENVVPLSELKSGSQQSPFFPALELEPGQSETDTVAVIDIEKALLAKILPNKSGLKLLTHIRGWEALGPVNEPTPPPPSEQPPSEQPGTPITELESILNVDSSSSTDDAGTPVDSKQVATIIGSRLPMTGSSSTIYLVSLEDRYHSGDNGEFNFQTATNSDAIRLVKLHSWQFSCAEKYKVTPSVINKTVMVNGRNEPLFGEIKSELISIENVVYANKRDFQNTLTTLLTPTQQETFSDLLLKYCAIGQFTSVLHHLDRQTSTLRLPDTGDTITDEYLRKGFYPVPHKMRQGGQTLSWYHGPLATNITPDSLPLPAKCADQILRYYKREGLFDTAYASAWELGRLLALQNKNFSNELFQWKRRYAQDHKQNKQQNKDGLRHLNGANKDVSHETLPESLQNWLADLMLLKGVPFNYLVPDEKLLPVESIRFFQLDRQWLHALLDGALSIGRVTTDDHALDTLILAAEDLLNVQQLSGFIMRSSIVSGWPGATITGYKSTPINDELNPEGAITPVHSVRLSENVKLCLFEDELKALEFHLKPDTMHFGVHLNNDGNGYEKILRDNLGNHFAEHKIAVPISSDRVLQVDALIKNINARHRINPNIQWQQPASSNNMAIQLLASVESVIFT